MSVVKQIKKIAHDRGLTLEEVIEPQTEKAHDTRNAIIMTLARTNGLPIRDLHHHTNAPVEFIKSLLRGR